MAIVYHIVIWEESDTNISMSLNFEGPIASLENAEAVALGYRNLAFQECRRDGKPAHAVRIGILCIEEAHESLRNGFEQEPLQDVTRILQRLNAKTEALHRELSDPK